jgi:hypothetical protein
VQIYVATGGYLDRFPVQDAKRFVEDFTAYLETRHPEVLTTIRETGDLPDDMEATLRAAIDEFADVFAPTDGGAGSEAAAGQGSKPDELRKDVGWDRVAAVDDDGKPLEERQRTFEEKAGPISDADAPAPPG